MSHTRTRTSAGPKPFVCVGGEVRSENDGEWHWLTPEAVCSSYGIDRHHLYGQFRQQRFPAMFRELQDVRGEDLRGLQEGKFSLLQPDPTGEYRLPTEHEWVGHPTGVRCDMCHWYLNGRENARKPNPYDCTGPLRPHQLLAMKLWQATGARMLVQDLPPPRYTRPVNDTVGLEDITYDVRTLSYYQMTKGQVAMYLGVIATRELWHKLSSRVVDMMTTIHDTRDLSRCPILADMLEECKYERGEVLDALRTT